MTPITINLIGSPGSLRIEIAENGWACCTLLCSHGEFSVGADTISVVADRIRRGLQGIRPTPQRQTIEIMGRQAFSAMLLSAPHHCLWVAWQTDDTLLIWQNVITKELPIAGTIHLSKTDTARWMSQFDEIERMLQGTDAWMTIPSMLDF